MPGAYGSVPNIPLPSTTLPQTLGADIGSMGLIQRLGGDINTFQNKQLAAGLAANLPGYKGLIGKSSGNIASMLAGEVPEDVVNQLIQSASERGIMTGAPGGPNANAALLRALGLTSLGMQQTGESELTAAIGRTPLAQPVDLTKFMISPEEQQKAAVAQAMNAAAPDPTKAAQASLANALAGLGAGRSSVSAPGAPQFSGYSPSYSGVSMGSPATGLTIGGVNYEPGTSPSSVMDNWNAWYSSLPRTGTSIYDQGPAGISTGEGSIGYSDFGAPTYSGQTGPANVPSYGSAYDLLNQPTLSDVFNQYTPGSGYNPATDVMSSWGDLFSDTGG